MQKSIKKIIDVIKNNATLTFNQIAEKTKLTRHTVSRVMNYMHDKKIIWGTYTVIDPEYNDKKTFILLITGKSNTDKNHELVKYFRKEWRETNNNLSILYSGILHGKYDIIIIFNAKDIFEARRFFSNIFKNQITNIQSHIILENLITVRCCEHINPNLDKHLEMLQNDKKI